MYPHRLLKVNYTTHNVHHTTDVIHAVSDHADVIVLAPGHTGLDKGGEAAAATHEMPSRKAKEAAKTRSEGQAGIKAKGSTVLGSNLFLYARVLGIYHANIIYSRPDSADRAPHQFDFLWVCWLSAKGRSPSWNDCCMDCVAFLPEGNQNAFGFLDPNDVLCRCHLILAFALGESTDGSKTHQAQDSTSLQKAYYVNRYVFYLTDQMQQFHASSQVL